MKKHEKPAKRKYRFWFGYLSRQSCQAFLYSRVVYQFQPWSHLHFQQSFSKLNQILGQQRLKERNLLCWMRFSGWCLTIFSSQIFYFIIATTFSLFIWHKKSCVMFIIINISSFKYLLLSTLDKSVKIISKHWIHCAAHLGFEKILGKYAV